MSRLIVKNLPSYVTPARLREHFSQKGSPAGIITDVKVSQKPDGTSRRFGFVGFKSELDAEAAQKWFDRTFIDSTRTSVAVSQGAKDAPAPRPNKRRRLNPPVTDSEPITDLSPTKTKSKEEGQLQKFVQVMQRKKGPAWANEALVNPPAVQGPTTKGESEDRPPGELSDLEWMRQRISGQVEQDEKVFEQSDDDEPPVGDPTPKPVEPQPESVKDTTRDTILQTARLFVRNLTFLCTNDELLELFQPFGEISQIHQPLDPVTKQRKGIAYITFSQPSSALAAYGALDKKSFQGRLIHILGAVDRGGKVEVETKKKSIKDAKAAKRKSAAGKDFNWSMLYMNSDAVASSIAARMNIDKSEILNPESGDNPAVKLALAETHIIQETKTYLESQGVSLSSFSCRKRSETTILVKNIPYGTTEVQIRELFEPHGMLTRVLVPPAGTMAIVDYEHPDEAAKGFRAVAYRRLGNSIIYLEKGPLGMFDENVDPSNISSTAITAKSTEISPHVLRRVADQELIGSNEDEQEPTIKSGSTLYIKNISFSTTQEKFTNVFKFLPSFSFARIQTKPDPNRSAGGRLSMGYGFVGFKDVDAARKALKSTQGFVLDGHVLHVSFAGRGAEEDEKSQEKDGKKSKSRTTKMIVKNVPFEATKKDIRDLFGSHGQLKSVRLPKRFDARSRGFAFLEFISRHEAENAYAALRHTHLLGRHLVLEWAEEAEQDIDALRKKAGVGYGDGKEMPGQKRKLNFGKSREEDPEELEV